MKKKKVKIRYHLFLVGDIVGFSSRKKVLRYLEETQFPEGVFPVLGKLTSLGFLASRVYGAKNLNNPKPEALPVVKKKRFSPRKRTEDNPFRRRAFAYHR